MFIEIMHPEATLFRENYVKHWGKNLTPASDGRLMVAHARILLPIELHKKNFTPVRYREAVFQIW